MSLLSTNFDKLPYFGVVRWAGRSTKISALTFPLWSENIRNVQKPTSGKCFCVHMKKFIVIGNMYHLRTSLETISLHCANLNYNYNMSLLLFGFWLSFGCIKIGVVVPWKSDNNFAFSLNKFVERNFVFCQNVWRNIDVLVSVVAKKKEKSYNHEKKDLIIYLYFTCKLDIIDNYQGTNSNRYVRIFQRTQKEYSTMSLGL